MMSRKCILTAAVLFSCVLSGFTSGKECDRACLENYIDRYMEAMLNSDPSLDLFARDCKFTENGVRLPLRGEGLWVDMSFPPTGESVEKLGKPHQVYFEVIPENKRPSREEMIKTVNYYFSGMQKNDGKGYYPFADDCHRLENGMPSTNVPVPEGQERPDPKTARMYSASWGCKEQFESGLLNFVTRVRDRRFVAVDR